ncbi:MAG: hypothetical protein N2C12_10470 [Planctomycetales bacterium]
MKRIATTLLTTASFFTAAALLADTPLTLQLKRETKIPSAPATESAKPTPTSSGLLEQRLTITDVKVNATIDPGTGYDNPSSFWDGQTLRPVVLAPQADGGAKIGWTDTDGTIHITPIDKEARRDGADVIIETGSLRDLVAHNDGSAALVLQEDGMFLIRTRGDETIFRTRLISNHCRDIHWGSVAWNGINYGTYFALHRGGHEGDALRFLSAEGELIEGGWNWGVSHSIDMRLTTVGDRFMPLALSDAYPGTGFYFNHNKKRVSYTWGDFSGGTGGRIGGMVAMQDKMVMAFSSREGGRKHWTVGLANFAQETPHEQTVHKYLVDADADQLNAKIANYGPDQLIVSWLEQGTWQRKFQLYDTELNPVGPSEVLPVSASPRADFRNLSNGDVAWAHGLSDGNKTLKVMKIQLSKNN